MFACLCLPGCLPGCLPSCLSSCWRSCLFACLPTWRSVCVVCLSVCSVTQCQHDYPHSTVTSASCKAVANCSILVCRQVFSPADCATGCCLLCCLLPSSVPLHLMLPGDSLDLLTYAFLAFAESMLKTDFAAAVGLHCDHCCIGRHCCDHCCIGRHCCDHCCIGLHCNHCYDHCCDHCCVACIVLAAMLDESCHACHCLSKQLP